MTDKELINTKTEMNIKNTTTTVTANVLIS